MNFCRSKASAILFFGFIISQTSCLSSHKSSSPLKEFEDCTVLAELNFRDDHSVNSNIIATLEAGTKLRCDPEIVDNAYAYCTHNETSGWLYTASNRLSCIGGAPITPGPDGKRTIGVNMIHFLDEHVFNEPSPIDKSRANWQVGMDNALALGATYIRVTASYQPNNLKRAEDMALTLCSRWQTRPQLKFLVAISEKSLEGSIFGSKLNVMKAWSRGEGTKSDHWQYTKIFVENVNASCPGAIFAWEPGNEILCHECIYEGDNSNTPPLPVEVSKQNYKYYENFLIEYTKSLRKLTANHPNQKIALGIIRVSWASHISINGHSKDSIENLNFRNSAEMFAVNPDLRVDWIKVYSQPQIDFITIHPYGHPERPAPHPYDSPSWFDEDLHIAKIVNKYVIMEEFGATPTSTGDQHRDPGAGDRVDSFRYWIDWAKRHDIRYISPWSASENIIFNASGMSWHTGSCVRDPNNEGSNRCKIERYLQGFLQ